MSYTKRDPHEGVFKFAHGPGGCDCYGHDRHSLRIDALTRVAFLVSFFISSPHVLIAVVLSAMPAHTLLSLTRRRSSARSPRCIISPRPLKLSTVYSVSRLSARLITAT